MRTPSLVTIELVDVTSAISVAVDRTPDGGCEIVADEMERLVIPLDRHDPRFHGVYDDE